MSPSHCLSSTTNLEKAVETWRTRLWERSRERDAIEIVAGLRYLPPAATWAYWTTTTCLERLTEGTAERLERATRRFVARAARETGTHLAAHYAIAATTDGGLIHAHLLLGPDPSAVARHGVAHVLTPRRRAREEPWRIKHLRAVPPIEKSVIDYLSGVVISEIMAVGLRPMRDGHQFDPYIEEGAGSGGMVIETDEKGIERLVDAKDLQGSVYIENQASTPTASARTGFEAICPGRFARARSCRRGPCAIGFPRGPGYPR